MDDARTGGELSGDVLIEEAQKMVKLAEQTGNPDAIWKARTDLGFAGQAKRIADLERRMAELEEALTTVMGAQVETLMGQVLHDAPQGS